jgi:flagellar assembly protein FliH
MRCKIADSSQDVEPVTWRSIDLSHRGAAAAEPPNSTDTQVQEVSRLQAELMECERRRQVEVAQARREAAAEGYRQAREEASAELNNVNNQIAQALSDLAGTKRKLRNDAEGELIKLSLAIARRILHREISVDPEALHGLVHTALQKLQNREISRVRVFPAGADAVRSALERIGAAPAIQVFPDSSLKSGDIIFETSFGELDASVDSQLQEIQRGFADRLSLR